MACDRCDWTLRLPRHLGALLQEVAAEEEACEPREAEVLLVPQVEAKVGVVDEVAPHKHGLGAHNGEELEVDEPAIYKKYKYNNVG